MPKIARTVTVYPMYSMKSYATHPRIMLQGKWLQDLGFEVGQKINVSVSENKLVIERSACYGTMGF